MTFERRSPGRIYPFCMRLAEIWSQHPDWRFGQLVANSISPNELFYIEEPEMMEKLEVFDYQTKKDGQ